LWFNPVFLLLVFDVVVGCLFGDVSDAFAEISVAPEAVAPQQMPEPVPVIFPQKPAAKALEILRQVWRRIVLTTAQKQMRMLRPKRNHTQLHAKLLSNNTKSLQTSSFYYRISKNITPILRRKLQMPITVHNTMAVVYIHKYTSRAVVCSGGIFQNYTIRTQKQEYPACGRVQKKAIHLIPKGMSFLAYVL
jgi:hypothetical protein